MRGVIAMMKHETNTFSPVPTDLARFGRGQPTPFYGDEAVRAFLEVLDRYTLADVTGPRQRAKYRRLLKLLG